jgi:threonine aldolase
MIEAMFDAEVGDDVFQQDPTINQLEDKAAKLLGMEAGIFCPSGTMTNQIAIHLHTQPLDEVLCDKTAHIYNYEAGAWAMHSGVSIQLLEEKMASLQLNR